MNVELSALLKKKYPCQEIEHCCPLRRTTPFLITPARDKKYSHLFFFFFFKLMFNLSRTLTNWSPGPQNIRNVKRAD